MVNVLRIQIQAQMCNDFCENHFVPFIPMKQWNLQVQWIILLSYICTKCFCRSWLLTRGILFLVGILWSTRYIKKFKPSMFNYFSDNYFIWIIYKYNEYFPEKIGYNHLEQWIEIFTNILSNKWICIPRTVFCNHPTYSLSCFFTHM